DLKLACPAYKMFNTHGVCEKCRNKNRLHIISDRCIHNSLLLSTVIALESFIHNLIGIYKKNVDRIVAPSVFFYNKFLEWGWASSKLVYIPNFIDTKLYHPNFTSGDYFLYIGRLVREKGVATLIRAIEQTGAKLCIAGSGPDEMYLRSLLQKKNSQVTFLGFISGEKLKNVIQNARAVVMPSEWYENAPISILEAYASGKPVIGSRIGGIPEMIQEGKTGYLFEMGNVEELAGILARLDKAQDQHIQEMGYCSHQYVTAEYSKKRYIDAMLSLYQAVGVCVPLT
ncbi:MAG: glycosyltransferase family 1 protein, partial [Candidatus Electrothrix sp. AX1]|nr:glycosyltransferase family 1 protein [Candidatus Electrothrix sp. AX1]